MGQAREQEWDELCIVSLGSNSWEELTLWNSRIGHTQANQQMTHGDRDIATLCQRRHGRDDVQPPEAKEQQPRSSCANS